MKYTSDLIDSLVADAAPVRRLRRPVARLAGWLLLATVLLTLVALVHGLRPDLALKLRQPAFVASVAAAIVTGILSAAAAFIASVPGRSRHWLWVPLPALAFWMGTIAYGCLTNWVQIGEEGISPGETVRCFTTLLIVSTPLSVGLLVMLRYVARLWPVPVAMCAALAVAAITAAALSFVHPLDASAMILLWNLGITLVFVTGGSCLAVDCSIGRQHLDLRYWPVKLVIQRSPKQQRLRLRQSRHLSVFLRASRSTLRDRLGRPGAPPDCKKCAHPQQFTG